MSHFLHSSCSSIFFTPFRCYAILINKDAYRDKIRHNFLGTRVSYVVTSGQASSLGLKHLFALFENVTRVSDRGAAAKTRAKQYIVQRI